MTEDDIGAEAAPVASAGKEAELPTSFGARLAAARERAGISVGDMAGRLRLHINQVRALEGENLAQLPEAAYVRGFVRSYARSLGLDPAPLVDDLNNKLTPALNSVVEGMTRTRDYSPVRAAAREHASRSLVLGLSVLALVALGAVGWYATRPVTSSTSPSAVVPAPAPAAPPSEKPTAAAPTAASVDAASTVPAVVEPAPAPSQPLPVAASVLSLSFNGSSWVEVTDAAGKVLLSQTARQGETLQPAGELPLSVVIGDASKATVTVRGQALNLESATRSNVARFTVK
jgi:cytoskeleton protein RodZ